MLKKTGSWIGSAKRYISNIQDEVADLDINEIDTEESKIKIKNNDKT